MRILIVDDCKDSVTALKLFLKRFGHDVHIAYDGPDAINTAEKLHPEVMLLDLELRSMSGFEVARKIREQPWARDTVLMAVTGSSRNEDRVMAQTAGFDSYVVKPFNLADLQCRLAELPAFIT